MGGFKELRTVLTNEGEYSADELFAVVSAAIKSQRHTAWTSTFRQRDDFLAVIGFANYEEYLQSALWEWIRSQLAAHGMMQCIGCHSRTGLAWHHRRYTPEILVGNFAVTTTADGTFESPIVRLCSQCHKAIHFSKGAFVPSLVDVEWRLQGLIAYGASGIDEAIKRLDEPRGQFDEFNEFNAH